MFFHWSKWLLFFGGGDCHFKFGFFKILKLILTIFNHKCESRVKTMYSRRCGVGVTAPPVLWHSLYKIHLFVTPVQQFKNLASTCTPLKNHCAVYYLEGSTGRSPISMLLLSIPFFEGSFHSMQTKNLGMIHAESAMIFTLPGRGACIDHPQNDSLPVDEMSEFCKFISMFITEVLSESIIWGGLSEYYAVNCNRPTW